MKKIGFIIFVVALVIGCVFANFFSWGKSNESFVSFKVGFDAEKGSGQTATEIREVSEFRKVDVGGVFQVDITAQKEYAVEVEADDNLLQFIKIEVKGDRLEISMDKRVKTSNPIRVRISAPDIEGLQASGASKVNITNLKNAELLVHASGASKFSVSGETGNLIVDVSGASQIDAGGLNAATANVDASGASNVSVNVSGELVADASGASRISYVGTPKVSKSTSGASSVGQK